ncbi:haloacid dehalogenase-like hydrolase [bacterium]|nr:haloacid dehalogenase-like hydrolase [bacterium]
MRARPKQDPALGHDDVLPSWNTGAARDAILRFVEAVTTEGGAGFVPPEERIAVFDNDGTLWCEQPAYVQGFFLAEQARWKVQDHPTLRNQAPYRKLLDATSGTLEAMHMTEIVEHIARINAGLTQAEFEREVCTFFATDLHPRFGVPFNALTYQPQLELLDFLRAHAFRPLIVSGGGLDFLRAVSWQCYRIPPNDVIGTEIDYTVREQEGYFLPIRCDITRYPFNDGPYKVQRIISRIGGRPILAVGNSRGDTEMLRYARDPARPSLSLLINHDDAVREYAYDTQRPMWEHESPTLPELAHAYGWQLVSMRRDFKRIFAFEAPPIP